MHWTQIAVAAALAVYIGAFVAIIVFVRRSTGANPRGHARGHLAAALLNGLASLLLLGTAIAYPLYAQSVDWFGRIAPLDGPLAQGLGAASLILAGVCLIWGEASLGGSFRVALPERRLPLVTHGIYRFTRNPLALSVDLLALGVLLLAPSWLALASLVLNVVAYEGKIRAEEACLRDAHGAAYEAYCERTGRYVPRLWRDQPHRGCRNEEPAMSERMTVWGVGPKFTLFSVLYLALALAIHYISYPFFVMRGIPYALLIVAGILLLAVGVPIWAMASKEVDRAFEGGYLATQGVYALCRHPAYGNAIFFTIPGILLFFRSWLLLTVPVAMYILFRLFIGKEEADLRQVFGQAYLAYASEVNAAFPRFWKLRSAFWYPVPTGKVAEHVYAVTAGDASMFIYADGEHAIAIDAGYGGEALRRQLDRIPVDPASVTHLFLTHGDVDHTGGLDLFPNAKVYLSKDEEQMIDGSVPRMLGLYHSPRLERLYTLLADGDHGSVGAIEFRAIATPGHTPGSMSYLINGRVLFTGDTLALRNGRVRTFYRLINMDTAAQEASIHKLARLEKISLLCTAHTGCTTDYALAMKDWRAR